MIPASGNGLRVADSKLPAETWIQITIHTQEAAEDENNCHLAFAACRLPPIAVLGASGRRSNSRRFPADFCPDLEALTGDRGGRQILRRFTDRILPVEAWPEELADVDTAEALSAMEHPDHREKD